MKNSSNPNRDIRIFLSSTFADLQSERDYLIKKVFPRLQIEAEKRNVSITPLDLRWGVTEEESKNGKVLQVCLQEIENSHPFFIGIVGNRYGWCPTEEELTKNEILCERWGDWLREDISKRLSVTEIEMQYGVLRSNANLDAFFYIKESGDDDTADIDKLIHLRNTIRNNGKYSVKGFDTPETLGMHIEQAFMELLDRRFPIAEYTEFDRVKYANEAFLNSLVKAYIERPENMKAIDDFLANDEQQYLVISGENGTGKSSLIANWIRNHSNDDYNILYHFIGNGAYVSDIYHIIDFIYEGVCRLYHLPTNLDEDREKGTKHSLDNILNHVSEEKPLLIILDGINQILDADDAKLLNWLPYPHKGVKLLFSTVQGDETYVSLSYRNYPIFLPSVPDSQDRICFIRNYLSKYGRHLTDCQVETIAYDPQNENMLVLRTMLDELLSFGVHEKLDERINYYLHSNSIDDFYQRVLERYEMDYPENFIKNALALIAFSRSGLQESEIIEMASATPLLWSQFYCAFHRNLIVCGGLVTFSHGYIADAVKRRYADMEDYCRRRIIRYFGGDKTSRSKYEVPYQIHKLKLYDLLYSLLLIPDVFQYHVLTDRRELATYWRALVQENPQKYRLSVYLDNSYGYDLYKFFSTAEELSRYYYCIGYFVCEFFTDYELVFECYKRSLSLIPEESIETATVYNNIGYIYGQLGQYKNSLAVHQTALDIRLRLLGKYNLPVAQSYGGMGFIYDKLGDYSKALDCFQDSLDIHRRLSDGIDNVFIANDYNNIGHVLVNMGSLQQGLEYQKTALTIRQRFLGDNNFDTAMSYHNVGAVLYLMDRTQEATPYLQTAYDIWISILGEQHPQVATGLYDLGSLYRKTGLLDKALEFMERALNIRIATIKENHPDTVNNYNSLADLCFQMQNYEKSRKYYTALYGVLSEYCTDIDPDYSRQIIALGGIGITNCMLGEYDEGESYLTNAINLCESYTPQNQQLLMGFKSHLFMTQLRRKQGLGPNEPIKIVIDTDK